MCQERLSRHRNQAPFGGRARRRRGCGANGTPGWARIALAWERA
jgi:hypothetical protein